MAIIRGLGTLQKTIDYNLKREETLHPAGLDWSARWEEKRDSPRERHSEPGSSSHPQAGAFIPRKPRDGEECAGGEAEEKIGLLRSE